MAQLPVDKHGRPVPWFVAWIDGAPDFRVIGPGKIMDAVGFSRCWVCGHHLGRYGSFVIGPMCAVNRVSAEPPSHHECATYSARACPFLTTPAMRRRDVPEQLGTVDPAGIMIARNPGVALVWTSRTWKRWFAPNGALFNIGEPTSVQWYANGREATRAEVLASIDSGLPTLRAIAELEGPDAIAALEAQHRTALELVPA